MPVPYNYKEYRNHIKQLQGVGDWVKGIKIQQTSQGQGYIVAWKKEILSQGQGGGTSMEEPGKVCRVKTTRDQIMFYALKSYGIYQQGEVWSKYYDSNIKEDFITDILIFDEQKFFITAHNSGDIHLRKLLEQKNLELEAGENDNLAMMQAHQSNSTKSNVLKGHSRKVTSLAPIKGKSTYFVSASLDGKLRIWCIEKMIELYCFDIQMDSPV